MAAFLVLWTVSDASDSWHGLIAAIGSADRVLPLLLGRALMAGIFVVLGNTSNLILHSVLVPLAIGMLIAGSAIFLPRL